jgi:hypothetical protein
LKEAYFEDSTKACVISKRTFLTMMIGTKMSDASPVLKVNMHKF